MGRLYVRTTGDDTTGDGTIVLPFRTIGKASTVWVDGDTIDVGAGEFPELNELTLVPHGSILGAGVGSTIVKPKSTTLRWIRINDLTTLNLTVGNLTIDQFAADVKVLRVDQIAPNAVVTFGRVEVKLQGGHFVDYAAAETTARVDVLNCYVRSRMTVRAGIAFRTIANTVAARNTIFTRLALVTDDPNGGLGVDLDYCLYYDNERDLRVGRFGRFDIRDRDPLLDPGLVPAPNSPARNTGLDLLGGFGSPSRLPPVDVDFGHHGAAPEIGVIETIELSGGVNLRTSVISTILESFGIETDNIQRDLAQSAADRSVTTASVRELYRRFGMPLGAARPSGFSEDQYRVMIDELVELARTGAPNRRAIERVVEHIWQSQPIVVQRHAKRRFPLGTALKVRAVHASPGDNTLTARVTAGEVLLAGVWWRVKQTDLAIPVNTDTLLYVDATALVDGTAQVKQTTDLQLLNGFEIVTQTGTALFRQGQTTLVGSGTAFTTQLARHDAIAPLGSLYRYLVDQVVQSDLLELRTPFRQVDFSGGFSRYRPVVPIGRVTTNGVTITAIRSEGHLGASTFLDTALAKRQAFDLILNETGQVDLDDNSYLNITLAIVAAFKSVHKLAAVSFLSEYPAGKFAGAVRPANQSNVDYLESAEDTSWPTS
jgi:hypothetical protein